MKTLIALAAITVGITAPAAFAEDENVLEIIRAQSASVQGDFVKTTPIADTNERPDLKLFRAQSDALAARGTFAYKITADTTDGIYMHTFRQNSSLPANFLEMQH